jgi:hypothetical protein
VIVISTAVVGGVSVLGSLDVVAVIFGYNKDLTSSRDRVLIGLMIANIIYSSANVVPLNLLRADGFRCGELYLGFDAIRIGRAVWFCGKYSLVLFELAIVALSAHALTKGIRKVKGWVEAVYYAACGFGGLAAFVIFYVLCLRINKGGYNAAAQRQTFSPGENNLNSYGSDDDLIEFTFKKEQDFRDSKDDFDALVQTMLLVWVSLAAIALILWFYVRWLHLRLLRELAVISDMYDGEFDRDTFAEAQAPYVLRKRRVLALLKEGYHEIAKPLEGSASRPSLLALSLEAMLLRLLVFHRL